MCCCVCCGGACIIVTHSHYTHVCALYVRLSEDMLSIHVDVYYMYTKGSFTGNAGFFFGVYRALLRGA